MKLTFSPASPFARKVRIAAIELGLIDKIELTPATVAPGTANEDYSRITPLKKLPQACETTAANTVAAAPNAALIHPGVMKYFKEAGVVK